MPSVFPRFATRNESDIVLDAVEDFIWQAAFEGDSVFTAQWAAATSGGTRKSGLGLFGTPRTVVR